MKVGILTYDTAHLKTQQVVFSLADRGYSLALVITPFRKRAARKVVFSHRPNQFVGPTHQSLMEYFGLECRNIEDSNWWRGLDIALVCGAGLLPSELLAKKFILNCHSGLIPATRGLDSFKWAIYHDRDVGNTLHFIDENVDMGKIVAHRITPVFSEDTLETFSRRHYELEIDMLSNFEYYLENGINLDLQVNSPTMRMPKEKEKEMIERFEHWKHARIKAREQG